jgi:uncharacterized membrane protein
MPERKTQYNDVSKSREPVESPVQDAYEVKIARSVVINKPREALYQYWHNFENLPNIMDHLESVEVLDDQRSHWVAKAPLGEVAEWDAEIVTDRENEVISWRSVQGSSIQNAGSVRFDSLDNGSTQLKVELAYNPPGGKLGATVAKMLGQEPSLQIEKDLERFKNLMERQAVA